MNNNNNNNETTLNDKTPPLSCRGQIIMSKTGENCPLAIPNQIFTISMHTPSLVKIHWDLLKLLYWNENRDVLQIDNSVKNWRNLPISNLKPDLRNINAHNKFAENPLAFTQVIVRKRNYWRTYNRRMDGPTDGHKRETIIMIIIITTTTTTILQIIIEIIIIIIIIIIMLVLSKYVYFGHIRAELGHLARSGPTWAPYRLFLLI